MASLRRARALSASVSWRTFFVAVRIRVRADRLRIAHLRESTIRFFALLMFGITSSVLPGLLLAAEEDTRPPPGDQLRERAVVPWRGDRVLGIASAPG